MTGESKVAMDEKWLSFRQAFNFLTMICDNMLRTKVHCMQCSVPTPLTDWHPRVLEGWLAMRGIYIIHTYIYVFNGLYGVPFAFCSFSIQNAIVWDSQRILMFDSIDSK